MKTLHFLFYVLFAAACSKDSLQQLKPNPKPIAVAIEEPPANYMDIISIPAQSNGPGRTPTQQLTATEKSIQTIGARATYIMAYASKSRDKFQILNPGVNSGDKLQLVGIQTFLGRKLLESDTTDIHLFQPAYSGRPIISFRPDSVMGRYITEKIAYIKQYAAGKGKVARFKNALWIQGETEVLAKVFDSSWYRKELEAFIENFRKAVGYDTHFTIRQFPLSYTKIKLKNLLMIRDIQATVGRQRNNSLLADDPTDTTLGDGLHDSKGTQLRLTEEYYKIIRP